MFTKYRRGLFENILAIGFQFGKDIVIDMFCGINYSFVLYMYTLVLAAISYCNQKFFRVKVILKVMEHVSEKNLIRLLFPL